MLTVILYVDVVKIIKNEYGNYILMYNIKRPYEILGVNSNFFLYKQITNSIQD